VTAVSPGLATLPRSGRRAGAVVVALGAGALLARPVLVRAVAHPTAMLAMLFVGLGLAGLCWPLDPAATTAAMTTPLAVLAVGVGALLAGRLIAAGTAAAAVPPPLAPLLLNGLAAVAEEAFFRRLLYGLLAPRGTTVAVVGSAACFAAVHVTVWGFGVLPLDLAAGLLFGWQRAATGRWTVPACTHVVANVLAVL